jgi:hypothetical protein
MVDFRGRQINVGSKMFLVSMNGMDTWGVDPITINKITDRSVALRFDLPPKRTYTIQRTAFAAVGGFKPELYWTIEEAQDVADAINIAKDCDKMLSRVAPIGELWEPHLVPKHLLEQMHDATKAIFDWWQEQPK